MRLFSWSWLQERLAGRPQTRSTPARKPSLGFRPQLEALEGRNLPSFSSPVSYSVYQPLALAAADVNGDAKPDLVTVAGAGNVLLNNGNGTFAAYQKVGPAGSGVVAADFNGDGYPDLAEVAASKSSIDVLLNNATW